MSNPFAGVSFPSSGMYYWNNIDNILISQMPEGFRGKLTGNEREALRILLNQLWEQAASVGKRTTEYEFKRAEDKEIERIADERAKAKLGWVLDNWNNLEAAE